MERNNIVDIADVYFIFADNIYIKYLTYEKFKALLNFYALTYGKIIIPDTFFINNKYLVKFFISEEGQQYIKKGIIVPSIRNGVTNLIDVYNTFRDNDTLIPHAQDEVEVLSYLEAIELNNALKWGIEQISRHFSKNIFERLDALKINNEDKEKWSYHLHSMSDMGILTRKDIRQMTNRLVFQDKNSLEIINSYVDISYNFNIPNFFGTSAAYPEQLMNQNMFEISPQDIFFTSQISKKNFEIMTEEDYIINTSLFDIGILSNLNAEQIEHIRKMKEYKSFIKCMRKSTKKDNAERMQDSFITYIEEFDRELYRIIDWGNKELIDSAKTKLKFTNLGRETLAGDGVGFIVDAVVEGVTASFIGAKLLGKAISIITKPITDKTENQIRRLELQGKSKVKQLETKENICDTIKQFSLNSVH
ncbi:hypothetical protein [Defluviitalea saccharophila]|uniref:Uncharacterized protein n=1 Tax=Defluviitalea saccharophila TaxID=879970 RepID=A0ABZ2Y751_9FIRM